MLRRGRLWIVLLAVVNLCAVFSAATAHGGVRDKRLDIYWIDVEGGAATLIVTPAGESVLIDTGNPGFRDSDRIVRTATQVAGLSRIDHLVITHYHRDHYGGASSVASLLGVRNVYDNGVFEGMPDNPGKEYFEFKCEKRHVIKPGDKFELAQAEGAAALSLVCLGTRQKFVPVEDGPNNEACAAHTPKDRDGSDNANSVVLLLQFGEFRFFDAGDLTWNMEYNLFCPRNPVGEVDVYQVTHHGLDSSNNPVVLQSLLPTVAIMNNGATKGCLPDVVEALRGTSTLQATYQMHKCLRPDAAENNAPSEYIANDEEKCQGNYLRLSVSPDGAKYTVGNPAKKHEREFSTRKKAAKAAASK